MSSILVVNVDIPPRGRQKRGVRYRYAVAGVNHLDAIANFRKLLPHRASLGDLSADSLPSGYVELRAERL